MSNDEMMDLVAQQRLALCDQLAPLTEEQWDTPSLDAGWRVRDVLGHLVSLQAIPTWRFMVGAGFGMSLFHKNTNKFALEYGKRDPAELLTEYRRLATGTTMPPIVGPIAPMTDIVVHSLDIERPLLLESITTDEVARMVLDSNASGLPGFVPKSRIKGLRFSTTDLEWEAGPIDGAEVRGGRDDLLLALNARPQGLDGLTGDGVAVLSQRIAES